MMSNKVEVYDGGLEKGTVIVLNGIPVRGVMNYSYSHDIRDGRTVAFTLRVDDFKMHFQEEPPCPK